MFPAEVLDNKEAMDILSLAAMRIEHMQVTTITLCQNYFALGSKIQCTKNPPHQNNQDLPYI